MGFLSSVGSILNDITGASSSAQQAQKYSKRLMKIQNDYNKEMMQNAHQWEVEDLKKAGLNPIISASGSGASPASGGLGGGATGQAGTNPVELLGGIISAKKALAEEENIDADTALKTAQTAEQNAKNPFIADYWKRQNAELASRTGLNVAKKGLTLEQTRTEAVKDITKKQARNAKELMDKRTKKDQDKINAATNQSDFARALYLGL